MNATDEGLEGAACATVAREQLLHERSVLREAEQHLGAGRVDRAIEVLLAGATLLPDSFEIAFNLGELLRERGELEPAVRNLSRATALKPADADAHFCLGVALHDVGRPEAAIDAYRAALERRPDDVEAACNLAATLGECGRLHESIERLEEICRSHPLAQGAWLNLAQALAESGDQDRGIAALGRGIRACPQAAELHYALGRQRMRVGQCVAAVRSLSEAVRLDGRNDRYIDALCGCLEEMEQFEAAWSLLEQAAAAMPERFPPNERHARLLARSGHVDRARALYAELLRSSPDDPDLLCAYSSFLIREGEPAAAGALLDRAIASKSGNAAFHFNRGVVYQIEGDFSRSAAAHREALRLDPGLGRAALNLVLDRSAEIKDAEVRRFGEAFSNSALDWDRRANFAFALGHVRHRRGDYEIAFGHFRDGNRIKSLRLGFDPERHVARVSKLIQRHPRQRMESPAPHGYGDPLERPVFIVGMPRCGSTLVETLLARAPGVLALGESPIVPRALAGTDEAALDEKTIIALRNRILCDWRGRPGYRPGVRICDKMLGNLFHLGTIARLFPGATVVHCIRHPVATCLSCYFQSFDHGMRFTYDLEHLATFYRQYRRLMAHWSSALRLRIVEIEYETLVADSQAVLSGLISACDLATEEAPASAPAGVINTASFWQARQPVYGSSVSAWRPYAALVPELVPLAGEYPMSTDNGGGCT